MKQSNSLLQAQLHAAHQDLAQARADALRHRQRERMHRDLHEDVGAILLSLIYRADSEPLAALARSALQDLRDVVRRADLTDVPLPEVLADWRAEIAQQVEAVRGQLVWSQQPALPMQLFSAACAMHWGRVVRHAVATLIHDRVQQLQIRVSYAAPYLLLEIDREPLCESPQMETTIRLCIEQGVAALRRRVTALAGQLEWRASSATQQGVICRIPLTV